MFKTIHKNAIKYMHQLVMVVLYFFSLALQPSAGYGLILEVL
jgi:hypothetical protein